MDYGFRQAGRLIVHGKSLVPIVANAISIPESRIQVVPHIAVGGSTALDDRDPAGQEDACSVLFFGRIWEYKGLEYLIRSEPLISEHIPDLLITIAGRGEDFSRYREMMRNPARFRVLNRFVNNEQRTVLFRRTAVVALPYISATQSGVIPVSYSFGKPVVATRVGAIPDSVDHGQTGLLVPPRNAEALADAIVTLLSNPKRRHEMGRRGQQKLAKEWAPEVVAASTTEVYRDAIFDRENRQLANGA